MRKWLWICGIAAVVAILNTQDRAGSDVGRLQPVQVVRVSQAHQTVRIDTDTGAMGEGASLEEAFWDMENTSAGEIFLDTAEFLILAGNGEDLLPELLDYLRPSCCVCTEVGDTDLEKAGAYLRVHTPELTMGKWRAGVKSDQKLVTKDGRMALVSG